MSIQTAQEYLSVIVYQLQENNQLVTASTENYNLLAPIVNNHDWNTVKFVMASPGTFKGFVSNFVLHICKFVLRIFLIRELFVFSYFLYFYFQSKYK